MKLAQPLLSDCTEWMRASTHLALTELMVIHAFCVSLCHTDICSPRLDRISGHYGIGALVDREPDCTINSS